MTDATVSWRELLTEATRRLRSAGVATADVDARRITEEASGNEGAALVLGLDGLATERSRSYFDSMLSRRMAGEPLQYVVGRWGFRTLDLMVDQRVLIPRPETEEVVEHALAELDRRQRGGDASAGRTTVVDLGSGSGAMGLSIAVERPGTVVWCVDASAGAVAVSRANLAGLGMAGGRVTVLEGSWFEPLPGELRGRIDLVVTNPPYVAATDDLPGEVADWEPPDALVAGTTGLEAIERIITDTPRWLSGHGALVAEVGETQGEAVAALARAAGFGHVEVRADQAGRDRALVARR